jgi:hypothetical protein
LLTAGFFVPGFHVTFVAVHLPAYIGGRGMDPSTGALALSLIGLFNIIGTTVSGVLRESGVKNFCSAVCIFCGR